MRTWILALCVVMGVVPVAYGITLTAENVPVNAGFTDNGDGSGLFTFAPDTNQAGFYQILFSAFEGNASDSVTLEVTVSELVQNSDSIVIILDSLLPWQIIEGETLHVIITAHIETVYVDTTEPEPDTGEIHSIVAYPQQSRDDGQEANSGGYVNTYYGFIELRTDNPLNRWGGAVRFSDIQIPQGAEILETRISVMNYVSTYDSVLVEIACENVDNALPLKEVDEYYDISNRWNHKTISVNWTGSLNTDPGIRTYSPDFSAALQQVVNRPGWRLGNAVMVFLKCKPGSYAEIFSWDAVDWSGGHSSRAVLEVKYK